MSYRTEYGTLNEVFLNRRAASLRAQYAANPYAVGSTSEYANNDRNEEENNGEPIPNFTEAVNRCFNKFATIKGRASRSEYWYWRLFKFLLEIATTVFIIGAILIVPPLAVFASLAKVLIDYALLIPSICVEIRRLHDTGRSGWYNWIGVFGGAVVAYGLEVLKSDNVSNLGVFIPLQVLGVLLCVWAFVFSLLPSQKGANKYGAQPIRPRKKRADAFETEIF